MENIGRGRNARTHTRAPAWLRMGEWIACWLRPFRSRRPAMLVIRPGSLGDALLFTGALRALRQRYPKHCIVLVSSRRARPIFERCPEPDVLLSFDETNRASDAIRHRLRRVVFAVRVLAREYDLAAVAWEMKSAAGAAREEVGWLASLMDLASAERKAEFDPDCDRNVHELERIVALLQTAGCDDVRTRQDVWPDAGLTDADRRWAGEVVERGE